MIVEKHFYQGKKKLFLLFWNCHRLLNSFHIELDEQYTFLSGHMTKIQD